MSFLSRANCLGEHAQRCPPYILWVGYTFVLHLAPNFLSVYRKCHIRGSQSGSELVCECCELEVDDSNFSEALDLTINVYFMDHIKRTEICQTKKNNKKINCLIYMHLNLKNYHYKQIKTKQV